MGRRPRIGDLIEIQTPAGLGYVQYVARDKVMGPQIRVLPGAFAERPDLGNLALEKALYYVHIPLGAAVSRGLLTLVGHAPLPQPSGSIRAEDDLYRIRAIWNDTMLAERLATGWRPV
jgi:hypothetical protein